MIGVNVRGCDRRFEDTAREFRETGDGEDIYEVHFAGIEREYRQLEKLANLVRVS